ncbi:lysophospholipid acyltransferase family protein [Candidatus Omnitrophota bacterium]
MFNRIAAAIVFLLMKVYCRMEIRGRHHIPKNRPFILASNHLSNLDPAVLAAACPRRLNFLAKEELFRNPFFARLIYSLGAFPLKRSKVDISALKTALKRLKKEVVLLFPEGTRDPKAKKPQAGVGFLVNKSGLAVVPARLYDTDKVLGPGEKFLKPHKIKVVFGKPLRFDKKKKPLEVAQEIIKAINTL